jgi:hypothetical protein
MRNLRSAVGKEIEGHKTEGPSYPSEVSFDGNHGNRTTFCCGER